MKVLVDMKERFETFFMSWKLINKPLQTVQGFENQLRGLQQQLAACQQQIADKDDLQQRTAERMGEYTRRLYLSNINEAAHLQTIDELKGRIDGLERDKERLQSRLEEKDEDLVDLSAQLAEKDEEINSLQRQLGEKGDVIDDLDTRIQEKDEEIIRLGRDLRFVSNERDEALAQKNTFYNRYKETVLLLAPLRQENKKVVELQGIVRYYEDSRRLQPPPVAQDEGDLQAETLPDDAMSSYRPRNMPQI